MQNHKITLFSALVGTLALGIEFIIFSKDVFALLNNADVYTAVGVGIGVYMLLPHFAIFLLACIFNWLGYGTKLRGFTLTAGILYCIALLLALNKAAFVIIPLVLSFVGFAKQATINDLPATDASAAKDDHLATELLITCGFLIVVGAIIMALIVSTGGLKQKDTDVLDFAVTAEDLENYKIDVDELMKQFPNGF